MFHVLFFVLFTPTHRQDAIVSCDVGFLGFVMVTEHAPKVSCHERAFVFQANFFQAGKSENWSTRLGPMNRVDGLLCDGDLANVCFIFHF